MFLYMCFITSIVQPFPKSLYFCVGGVGEFGSKQFKEISKRFNTRIDPQNPLPSLIIRTKNFNLF